MSDDLLVDFDDDIQINIPNNNLYSIEYDSTTTEFYRVTRERKLNTILQNDINFYPEKSFKFPYQWDPYTGERTNLDPYGSLCFHPDDLIYYFYLKRLDILWTDPKDETGGYYEGYYGDALGSGNDIFVNGRGSYTELYLFRLPIIDCYLHKKHDMSIITMGPKLTDLEIAEIDKLANIYYKDNYYITYGKNRPSLSRMKYLYDQAISKFPDLSLIGIDINNKNIKSEMIQEYRNNTNRNAVDLLKKM